MVKKVFLYLLLVSYLLQLNNINTKLNILKFNFEIIIGNTVNSRKQELILAFFVIVKLCDLSFLY